jgi:hypothetical protein
LIGSKEGSRISMMKELNNYTIFRLNNLSLSADRSGATGWPMAHRIGAYANTPTPPHMA